MKDYSHRYVIAKTSLTDDHVLTIAYKSQAMRSLKHHIFNMTSVIESDLIVKMGSFALDIRGD